jgi:tetratricopeptide (TPR) repeat protein
MDRFMETLFKRRFVMIQKKMQYLSGFLLIIMILMTACAAPQLDEAKRQYEMALVSDNPLPHYKAALESLDAAITRDPNQLQAYAIKGLIYRNLEDYDRATENLEIAKQGSFSAQLQWVPVVTNLTYGDIFHAKATTAIRAGNWELAKSYQDNALEFFSSVLNTTFAHVDESSQEEELGISMQDMYIKALGRWAAGKSQMATIEGSGLKNKEQQSELLREVTNRLSSFVETYPDSTSLRYYLAEGYRKQALTVRKADPAESERLQALAVSQLRVCAELGLPGDLRSPAAQLFSVLSKGAEPEVQQKLMGNVPGY